MLRAAASASSAGRSAMLASAETAAAATSRFADGARAASAGTAFVSRRCPSELIIPILIRSSGAWPRLFRSASSTAAPGIAASAYRAISAVATLVSMGVSTGTDASVPIRASSLKAVSFPASVAFD